MGNNDPVALLPTSIISTRYDPQPPAQGGEWGETIPRFEPTSITSVTYDPESTPTATEMGEVDLE